MKTSLEYFWYSSRFPAFHNSYKKRRLLGVYSWGKLLIGNVFLRNIATTDGRRFKAGQFKYYQIHKTETKSRGNIYHIGERKKTCKLVSRTEGWSEGKKIEQTKIGDFFTRTFRLLHVFILSNIAGVPIDCYFSSLFVSVQLDMLQTDPTLPCINSAISPWE